MRRILCVRQFFAYSLFLAFLLMLNACTKNDTKVLQIKPNGPKPAWGPTIHPQMLAVVEKFESYNEPPLYTLPAQEARQYPPIQQAAADVANDYHIHQPYMNVDTMGMFFTSDKAQIHVRVYTPSTGKSSYPVIVYYHGGGWVLASTDVYDASCRALCSQSDAILVSVDYRLAPEYKFPTADNDAYNGYVWAMQNASAWKGDTSRIAVVGESAGGNLACAVSLMARDNGIKMPVHQVLVYPIANSDFNTPSYIQYADAIPLNKPLMEWFFANYLSQPSDASDPRITLVHANLHNLPSSTVISAEIDPLQSEGKMLADNLQAAGVPVTYQLFTGVTHEFFGMGAVLPEAKVAEGLAAGELRKAFHN